jgi:hypothetical protein
MTFLSRLMEDEWLTSVQDLITSTSSEQGQKYYRNQTRQGQHCKSLSHTKSLQKADYDDNIDGLQGQNRS